ncbi:MAG TPA: glycosyltransferase family 4 protein [Sphingomicrobium sp.]|nr:glycosyltransferase family 4 protein [Sphingomicrobium sp.]
MRNAAKPPVKILLAANSTWNLVNFRSPIICELCRRGFEVIAAAPVDESAAALQAMGVRVEPIEIDSGGLSPVADALLVMRYYRMMKRVAPAALLAFTPKPNIYSSIAARWAGVPVINTITGLGTGFLSGAVLQKLVVHLYRMALRNSTRVFFHNDEDRALFLRLRLVRPDQAAVVAGSGIDLHAFAPGRGKSSDAGPTFLFIGRLLRDKGIVEFAEAARQVRAQRPARFQIVGAPERHPKAVAPELVESWVDEGIVEVLGRTDDVRPYIEQADCVVLPSYREGLPRAILEASAMGKPVIAADVPGCRQAVESGVTGLLCEARSSRALAEAMLSILDMPEDRRLEMGRRGRDKAERGFSEKHVVASYLEVIEQLERESHCSPI